MPRAYREPEYRRRIREKAEQDKKATDAKEQEATQKRQIENITATIHRVEEEFYRSNDEEYTKNKKKYWWEKAGVVGLWAAAFIGLAAIVVSSIDSHEQRDTMNREVSELHIDKRAWLNPTSLDIVQEWGSGSHPDDYIQFTLHVSNSGREPAINTSVFISPELFPINDIRRLGDKSVNLSVTDIPLIKQNNSCDAWNPMTTGMTIYPTISGGLGGYNGIESRFRASKWRHISDMIADIKKSSSIFYINGCLSYTTLNEIHHSKFCLYLLIEGGIIAQQPFRDCPTGNEAD